MDLQKQVMISPRASDASPPGRQIDRPQQVSLFEAVRRWTDAEGLAFDIVVDGHRLSKEQIEDIAHSEPYKSELLGFDERR
jgi:hypothetical protein